MNTEETMREARSATTLATDAITWWAVWPVGSATPRDAAWPVGSATPRDAAWGASGEATMDSLDTTIKALCDVN